MWENVTRYSKSDDRSKVRTVRLTVGQLSITVTKRLGCGDDLFMYCHELNISEKPLGLTDMEEAQKKAIEVARTKAKKILYTLDQI